MTRTNLELCLEFEEYCETVTTYNSHQHVLLKLDITFDDKKAPKTYQNALLGLLSLSQYRRKLILLTNEFEIDTFISNNLKFLNAIMMNDELCLRLRRMLCGNFRHSYILNTYLNDPECTIGNKTLTRASKQRLLKWQYSQNIVGNSGSGNSGSGLGSNSNFSPMNINCTGSEQPELDGDGDINGHMNIDIDEDLRPSESVIDATSGLLRSTTSMMGGHKNIDSDTVGDDDGDSTINDRYGVPPPVLDRALVKSPGEMSRL